MAFVYRIAANEHGTGMVGLLGKMGENSSPFFAFRQGGHAEEPLFPPRSRSVAISPRCCEERLPDIQVFRNDAMRGDPVRDLQDDLRKGEVVKWFDLNLFQPKANSSHPGKLHFHIF